jgi:hypothetical protein
MAGKEERAGVLSVLTLSGCRVRLKKLSPQRTQSHRENLIALFFVFLWLGEKHFQK